jgi:hypothetical protein
MLFITSCHTGRSKRRRAAPSRRLGQALTKEQISQLVDNVALRAAIKHFFTRSLADLKVRTGDPSPYKLPGLQCEHDQSSRGNGRWGDDER